MGKVPKHSKRVAFACLFVLSCNLQANLLIQQALLDRSNSFLQNSKQLFLYVPIKIMHAWVDIDQKL